MGATILAAEQLTRNEISSLARVFEATLRLLHEPGCFFPSADDYAKDIRTVVGLSFTAILVDGSFFPSYQKSLETFLRYRDLENCPKQWSEATAEMIETALNVFAYIQYPHYFQSFAKSLRRLLSNVRVQLDEESTKVADKLLAVLEGKCCDAKIH